MGIKRKEAGERGRGRNKEKELWGGKRREKKMWWEGEKRETDGRPELRRKGRRTTARDVSAQQRHQDNLYHQI